MSDNKKEGGDGRPRRAFFVRLTQEQAEYVSHVSRRCGCNAQQVIRAALLHMAEEDPDYPDYSDDGHGAS